MKQLLNLTLIILLAGCNRSGQETQPVRKEITQAVYASGKLYPIGHYTVFSKIPGYVERVFVSAGQSVHRGDPLVSVRNETNEMNLESARNLVELAKLQASQHGPVLSGLDQEVRAAKARYLLDSTNATRTASLWQQQATSRQQLDQAQTQFELSKSQFQRAKENYTSNRERLEVEYRNAVNQLEALTANRSEYRILSVLDGKVYDVIPEVGDLVNAQTPLVEIGDSSRFEVELAVDETDIALLHTGQPVVYAIDAYRDSVFHGVISEIIPRVNVLTKSSRVKATFNLSPGVQLYTGMSAEANILISEKKNALVIPKEFVRNGNQVRLKGEDQPRTIRKGIEDLQFIEVLEGLSEQDILVK